MIKYRPKTKKASYTTAGFGSFVANAVTYLRVAAIPFPKKFDIWYHNAVKISKNVLESVTSKRDFMNYKNLKDLSIH